MAPEWRYDYLAFYKYIEHYLGPRPSPNHSIDRRDNDGDYKPGNLKWSTPSQQVQNSRQATELTKSLTALVWDETL